MIEAISEFFNLDHRIRLTDISLCAGFASRQVSSEAIARGLGVQISSKTARRWISRLDRDDCCLLMAGRVCHRDTGYEKELRYIPSEESGLLHKSFESFVEDGLPSYLAAGANPA